MISADNTFTFSRSNGTSIVVTETVRQAPILTSLLAVANPLAVNRFADDVTGVEYEGFATGSKRDRNGRVILTFYDSVFLFPSEIDVSCPPRQNDDGDDDGGDGGGSGDGGSPCSYVEDPRCNNYSQSGNVIEETAFNFGKRLPQLTTIAPQNEIDPYVPPHTSLTSEIKVGTWQGESW